jgi:hypothetical protein
MTRLIHATAIALVLGLSGLTGADAKPLNTTPLNTLGQPVGSQPVITGALPRNTTISSSINPGASSLVATTLQIHPWYTLPAAIASVGPASVRAEFREPIGGVEWFGALR